MAEGQTPWDSKGHSHFHNKPAFLITSQVPWSRHESIAKHPWLSPPPVTVALRVKLPAGKLWGHTHTPAGKKGLLLILLPCHTYLILILIHFFFLDRLTSLFSYHTENQVHAGFGTSYFWCKITQKALNPPVKLTRTSGTKHLCLLFGGSMPRSAFADYKTT